MDKIEKVGSSNIDSSTSEEIVDRAVVPASESFVNIGRNVQCMRELRGWTQAELARKAQLSRTTVRRIEEGMPCWRPTLERLAAVFNIPVQEFTDTNRFSNVLDANREFVTHEQAKATWRTRGDRRANLPANNEEVIQCQRERRRLGKLGFVPAFVCFMDFYLPAGPGIIRMELYARHEQRFMPQFAVVTMYVLHGSIEFQKDDQFVKLNSGDAIAFDSSATVAVRPVEPYTSGAPCELLLVGAQRQKLA